jgi:hypothetical protein
LRKVVARVGYVLLALIIVGICLDILVALRGNHPFYGVNYLGQPLGAYSVSLVLIIAAVIGIVRLMQLRAARKLRNRR